MVSAVAVEETLAAPGDTTAWLSVTGIAHRKSVGRDYFGVMIDDTSSYTGQIQVEVRVTNPATGTQMTAIAAEFGSAFTGVDYFDTLPTMEVRVKAKSGFSGSADVMLFSGADR